MRENNPRLVSYILHPMHSLPLDILERVAWYIDDNAERAGLATVCRVLYTAVRRSYKSVTYRGSCDWHELTTEGLSAQSVFTRGAAPVFPHVRHVHVNCDHETLYGAYDFYEPIPGWMKPSYIRTVFPRVETIGFAFPPRVPRGNTTRFVRVVIGAIASGAYDIGDGCRIPVSEIVCSASVFLWLAERIRAHGTPNFNALRRMEYRNAAGVAGFYAATSSGVVPTAEELTSWSFAPRDIVIGVDEIDAERATCRIVTPVLRSSMAVRGSKAAVGINADCLDGCRYLLEVLPYALVKRLTLNVRALSGIHTISNSDFYRAWDLQRSSIHEHRLSALYWLRNPPGPLDDARTLRYYSLGLIRLDTPWMETARALFLRRLREDAIALAVATHASYITTVVLGRMVYDLLEHETMNIDADALARYLAVALRLMPAHRKLRWCPATEEYFRVEYFRAEDPMSLPEIQVLRVLSGDTTWPGAADLRVCWPVRVPHDGPIPHSSVVLDVLQHIGRQLSKESSDDTHVRACV